ncbi:putative lipid II flippase FtsW, partial [Patescibacteria group bacterium]|nr:putative lipid II flippase FtsW [Patescibacteria group bacterium]
KQQLFWAAIGLIFLLIFANIKYTFWKKIAVPLYYVSLCTLILVFIPGFGTRLLGAKRWLSLGPISLQPSEFVKLTLALYLAKLTSTDLNKPHIYFIPIALTAFLVILQPDFGTTIVIAAIGMAQIFVSGINLIYFLSAISLSAVAGTILVITSKYRRERLMTFITQTQDPLGKGYHVRQILLALGTGGFFGLGLGQSRQKYLFLPETAADSIFAVIAEEVGFLGSTILLLIFAFFIFKCLKIAGCAPDKFSKIFIVGVVAWIGGQTFLNIGSMLAVIPLTGIPLPFISYGGSSLVAVLMAVGIIVNISKHVTKQKRR